MRAGELGKMNSGILPQLDEAVLAEREAQQRQWNQQPLVAGEPSQGMFLGNTSNGIGAGAISNLWNQCEKYQGAGGVVIFEKICKYH